MFGGNAAGEAQSARRGFGVRLAVLFADGPRLALRSQQRPTDAALGGAEARGAVVRTLHGLRNPYAPLVKEVVCEIEQTQGPNHAARLLSYYIGNAS